MSASAVFVLDVMGKVIIVAIINVYFTVQSLPLLIYLLMIYDNMYDEKESVKGILYNNWEETCLL